MAGVLQHLRSSTLNKRPNPASMVDGQLAINYASGSPGAFFKDSNGNLVKVGPVHVGATAPNVSPASGGTAGNSLGEQWLDTSGGTYVFKIWDGAAWRSEAGEFVNVTGDTMTGALGIIAGSASTPGLFFSGDANSGLYSPGADQVAISTGGSGRLFVDASGRVGVGTSSPLNALDVAGNISLSSGGSNVIQVLQSVNAAAYTGPGFYSQTSIGYGVASGGTHRWIGGGDGNTELMRLTSTGLGIGTTSPQSALSFASGSHIGVATTDAADNGVLTIGGAGAASNTRGGYIELYGNENASLGNVEIAAGKGGASTATAGSIIFRTGPGTADERARIDSSGRLLVGTSSQSGGALLQVNGDRVRIATAKTPASATDTGTAGEICWDASYVYVCTATNTWKRSALSTW